ncbi:hypothetical protein [Natronomonas sp. LN261]|uniref:DUF7093 family protein n=1 Tax=Natronomonas sp. LN261 TaxID=2750669 RepID=UPI0015EF200D|nr:hypothetical protein [Natronomonas sp. LN261]
MGLQCSILGHAFEDAGVEREREEQGSEVITTEREIERCRRCGTERVVSESTEVAAVVDASDVGLEGDHDGVGSDAPSTTDSGAGGGIASAVERSGVADTDSDPEESGAGVGTEPAASSQTPDVPEPAASSQTPDVPEQGDGSIGSEEPPDPAEEDAEILTDETDEQGRNPGQWPEESERSTAGDPVPGAGDDSVPGAGDDSVPGAGDDSVPGAGDELTDRPEDEPPGSVEESLSGITVPEGEIVCPECPFRIDANSGYRAGDPCPECNAWLEAERNQ